MLHLISCVTYLDSVTDGELVSFLRASYMATQSSLKLSLQRVSPRTHRETCEHGERNTEIYRKAIWAGHMNRTDIDPTCAVPEMPFSGSVALLRILTVLAQRGTLDQIPSWTSLPADVAPFTDLRQVQQITSPAVIKKLLPLVLKLVVLWRERTRLLVARDKYMARVRYLQIAQLAEGIYSFRAAAKGYEAENLQAVTKELVLSLGNAAEMSLRVNDPKAAVGIALVADTIGKDAKESDGIEAEILQKNQRRLESAKKALKVKLC